MNIEVNPAPIEDKSILRNLLELYAYEFSEFDSADVNQHGLYGYEYLDHYWTEAGRYPFLVRIDDQLAGFVLVRTILEPGEQATFSIAEFFVLRKYRKLGAGRRVAYRMFDMFSGCWSVAEMENNLPAQAFWRKVIGEYTHGNFEEIWLDDEQWRGPVQKFTSPSKDVEG